MVSSIVLMYRISDFDILTEGNIAYLTQNSRHTVIDVMGNPLKTGMLPRDTGVKTYCYPGAGIDLSL
ncbi:hypothetical protein WJR50_26785 [Catalinimonas sp. 4WD22]|uniref:hypothetical protein n=1 Tax=Catalinimonas locisalis TaxID=3133978 RepID=UPI0031014029